ncbi:hypothetical protein PO124_10185 [Bacillus licheniformis]|nr:hypothetical protein [Bacillus licheniformis]
MIADAAGRGLVPPLEIPAGLIAAVIGGPYLSICCAAKNIKRDGMLDAVFFNLTNGVKGCNPSHAIYFMKFDVA